MIADWDDAYANAPHIADAADYPPIWQQKARNFRDNHPPRQLSYGADPRQLIDLFLPKNPVGLAVFVHGGYWRSFDHTYWSHLARGALAQGWAVAIPGYVLCPQTTIPEITMQIAAAIDILANNIAGPIHLAGHSAGGHLVCRMGCRDIRLASAKRIKNILSISGIHDLRPLINTDMNKDLMLNLKTATSESPAMAMPIEGLSLTAWVGALERPEFLRQNRLIANIWTGCGVNTRIVEQKDQHHFSVISGLESPDSPLTRALIDVNQ